MIKNSKAFISMLLITTIILSSLPLLVNANDDIDSSNVVDIIQEAIDSEDYAATATKVAVDEAEYIWGMIRTKLDTIGFCEELRGNIYIEKDDTKIEPVKIIDDRYTNLMVYYYVKIYEDNFGNLVSAMFVYDENTNSLLKVEANKISKEGDFESFFNYSEYNKRLTRDFSIWGQNFLCATTGLIACTAYCAMIGVLSAPVAIGCSLVCGTAFNAACS
ncbi:hypothetical protein acsn021_02940 [Anaerocolumna cellulosilytica]|uniref:Uncharacterized protein n=1 Tax=Anaerocolumna cellulosilytica TaxID=433286 RepID=A0A6S6QZB1_9FIRM|nr:putative immunity/bacteriocin fusion bifunctional protein [Anaerocolumna cellulosilytica]MBB5196874.1 putative immunity protein/bacteriocin [Anaerocolumna cellulosilytica]BCJ92725.1 hypothetical protein acsn021_02940 [Anaerocolumna cellulosilytica]